MKINRANLDSWSLEPGGKTSLDIDATDLSPVELSRLLEQIKDQLGVLPVNQTAVCFTKPLTTEQSQSLIKFIKKNTHLPFATLSLTVDVEVVKSAEFKLLTDALNRTDIQALHLEIPEGKNDRIATRLLSKFTDQIHYPIKMNGKSPEYKKLTDKLIRNMQKHNAAKLLGKKDKKEKVTELESSELELPESGALEQKIRLKEIIQHAEEQEKQFDQYIKLEVQHIEVEQQEQVQQVEEVMQEEIVEEQQEEATYDGELIGYREFQAAPYADLVTTKESYKTVKSELFGNLPKAVKYLTPEAATVLAKNLAALATFNIDNLPQNFVLKQTEKGELVLDYDIYAPERKGNIYTPKESAYVETKEPIYDVQLPVEVLKDVPFAGKSLECAPRLKNMWIKYGNAGVELFFKALKQCNHDYTNLADLLFDKYLKHFNHWDHFLADPNFFECLEKIGNYDQTKLTCLLKFLEQTGTSRHDLKSTIDGFEVFWEEWEKMSVANQIDIGRINGKWETPVGGNPLVYMERLMTILKNARNLSEQVDCLDGIKLDNYTAYYASRYEGFKVVSSEMALTYDADAQDKLEFSPDRHVYMVDLDYMFSTPMNNKDSFKLCCRYIGQQQKSIPLKQYSSEIIKRADRDFFYNKKAMLTALMFVAHERYTNVPPFAKLLAQIEYTNNHDVLDQAVMTLFKLFKLDIRLSPAEGMIICTRLAAMNSAEYESLGIGKVEYIKKIYNFMLEDKYAVFKCFQTLAALPNDRWPFAYALDTTEFFRKDPEIAKKYKQDLLLFSTLINTRRDEVYFEAREDEHALSIIANLERVKAHLHNAATGAEPNNLDYAFRRVVRAERIFGYEPFLSAFDKISKLKKFDYQAVDKILVEHEFKLSDTQPTVTLRSGESLKATMLGLLMMLKEVEKNGAKAILTDPYSPPAGVSDEEKQQWQQEFKALSQLGVTELQRQVQEHWKRAGTALSVIGKGLLVPIFSKLTSHVIEEEFLRLPNAIFANQLAKNIQALKDFSGASDFIRVEQIAKEAAKLASIFEVLMKRDNVKVAEEKFTKLFAAVDYSIFDYKSLFSMLTLFADMPQRDYLGILEAFLSCEKIIKNKKECIKILELIQRMNINEMPSIYIENVIKYSRKTNIIKASELTDIVIKAYQKDSENPILKWLLTEEKLSTKSMKKIAELVKRCHNYQPFIHQLLQKLHTMSQSKLDAFIDQVLKIDDKKDMIKIIEIVAKSNATTSRKTKADQEIDYADVVARLTGLATDEIDQLHQFCTTTAISLPVLHNGLINRDETQTFDVFLEDFEKAPLGKRDFDAQFDISEVERVINSFVDLNNQAAYSYTYRKQMMEAFLFINKAGLDLPTYRNKAARELTNHEIQEIFLKLKRNSREFSHLDPFQRRLYALGLMREAMYRSTGQFPYSTQIIGLIDCIMHQGDVISNIDTGEGKSLIDPMKAALLWLDSDRVDMSTSSIEDAKRDINIYSPFLSLLGIPHAKKPISSSTPFEDYQVDGINYSTMSQLALFYSKAKGAGKTIGKPKDRVSVVMNESDYTVLDNKTIYRNATTTGAGVGEGNEWIYYALNSFVQTPEFMADTTTKTQDIALLKKHLINAARKNKKSLKIINKFSDKQLLTWLDSAIIVNYRLREKRDYVLTPTPEVRVINGKPTLTRVAKILMKEDLRVSPDIQYGDGMQQLLHAKLNSELGDEGFVITPESKTIISVNNRNMIDFYRSKKGFIWGSSATTGSGGEIDIQYLKYGFEFSQVPPHREKQVKIHKQVILQDEEAHFKYLIKLIKKNQKNDQSPPGLVFFKDIFTAERFYARLQTEFSGHDMQLYTGLGNEEQVVQDAAKQGMITVTTLALSRNTDVLYNKEIGMDVYGGFPDTKRRTKQRSGRTGRQGSPGDVYTVLNQQDFPGLTVEEYIEKVEAASEKEREFNEELYNIVGYFLHLVETESKQFFRESWAVFSDDVESRYREAKLNRTYQRDQFVDEVVKKFNDMTGMAVTGEQVIKHLSYAHPKQDMIAPYTRPVALEDCTSPDVIAYHFMNCRGKSGKVDKDEVKIKLQDIFAGLAKKASYDASRDYIKYLNAGDGLHGIRAAHQEFLTEFLEEQANISKKKGFVARFTELKGPLNQIASNANYLLMFKALIEVHGDKVSTIDMTDTIKKSINTLLGEYLQHSWFVSSGKKKAVKQLIAALNGKTELTDIIILLQSTKLELGQADIEANKASFWRSHIKPVHVSGHSRLQSTLDRALLLTSSLTNQAIDHAFVGQLTDQLDSVLKTPLKSTHMSFDTFKMASEIDHNRDRHNASVVAKSVERVLKFNSQIERPESMKGRFKLFDRKTAENKARVKEKKSKPDKDVAHLRLPGGKVS